MKCLSKKELFYNGGCLRGFSLVEAVTALIILALFSSSVLVVISRSMASAADSAQRMQAFEVARENMEALLAKNSVEETTEYGNSDRYPEIQWETTVTTFYEPATSRIWAQAVCNAEYIDSEGEKQKVELTHWLTDISKEQLLEMLKNKLEQFTEEQVIESIEEAAEYAGVDVETIEKWIANGMRLVKDGKFKDFFIKSELDLYKRTGGNPSEEDRLAQAMRQGEGKDEEGPIEEEPEPHPIEEPSPDSEEKDPDNPPPDDEPCVWVVTLCGMTDAEWRQLGEANIEEMWRLLWACKESPVRECR